MSLESLAEFSEQQIQTKKFIFLLATFGKLFDTSNFATKGLQSSTLCISDWIDLIEILKKKQLFPSSENTDGDFDKVLKLTKELMSKKDISDWDVTSS